MDIDKLQAAKTEIEGRFNTLKEQHSGIEVELNKIQGEWRAVVNFIKEIDPEADVSDPEATTHSIPVTVLPNDEVSV